MLESMVLAGLFGLFTGMVRLIALTPRRQGAETWERRRLAGVFHGDTFPVHSPPGRQHSQDGNHHTPAFLPSKSTTARQLLNGCWKGELMNNSRKTGRFRGRGSNIY